MKKLYLSCLILALCVLSAGCSMPKNLHFLDRIPHEQQKGFVTFITEVEGDDAKRYQRMTYSIEKIEQQHRVAACRPKAGDWQLSVTDRPGEHEYVIHYASEIGYAGQHGSADPAIYSGGGLVGVLMSNKIEPWAMKDRVAIKRQEHRVGIRVVENQTTVVRLRLKVSKPDNAGDSSGPPMTAQMTSSVEAPIRMVTSDCLILEGATGPRTYAAETSAVYDAAFDAAKGLGWRIDRANEVDKTLVAHITRFGSNPLEFDIGVHALPDGGARLDISSRMEWQKWGTYNTGMSLKRINQFYDAVDRRLTGR